MMMRPDDLVGILVELDRRQAHQRRSDQIKTALAVGVEKSLQLLVLVRRSISAPVKACDRHLSTCEDDLQRLIKTFPEERGAEDGMPSNHDLPGLLKRGEIDLALHRPGALL